MEKAIMVYLIIEGVIFLLPLISLFMKLGRYAERIDKLEQRIEEMSTIDNRLTTIETKIDLLLENKLRINDNNTGTSGQ